jgi:hypothetical protein
MVEMGEGEAVQAGGGLAQSEEGGQVVYVGEDLKEELFWELIEMALCGGNFEVIQSGLHFALALVVWSDWL